MTRLASTIDVQKRRADVVVTYFQCTFSLEGHVAIGTNHTGTRMNSLVPHFKLRVLRLQHWRAGFGVVPVFEFLLVIKSQNVFYL